VTHPTPTPPPTISCYTERLNASVLFEVSLHTRPKCLCPSIPEIPSLLAGFAAKLAVLFLLPPPNFRQTISQKSIGRQGREEGSSFIRFWQKQGWMRPERCPKCYRHDLGWKILWFEITSVPGQQPPFLQKCCQATAGLRRPPPWHTPPTRTCEIRSRNCLRFLKALCCSGSSIFQGHKQAT
jgi:hypothetical protein